MNIISVEKTAYSYGIESINEDPNYLLCSIASCKNNI